MAEVEVTAGLGDGEGVGAMMDGRGVTAGVMLGLGTPLDVGTTADGVVDVPPEQPPSKKRAVAATVASRAHKPKVTCVMDGPSAIAPAEGLRRSR